MVNYQNGKIYAIRSFKTDEIYIGSTTQKLCQRLQKHKSHKKEYEEGITNYTTSFKILDYGDAYIELIENYPCKSKEELLKKEGEYIRNTKCVNKINPIPWTKEKRKEYNKEYHKEQYEKNKEVILQKKKEYKEKNKDKIKEYYEKNKEKIKQKSKEHYEKNKDKIKEYREKNKDKIKEYREKNKDKIKEYREKNKDKIKEYREKNKDKMKEYYEKNKDKIKQKVKCPHCEKEMRKDSINRHIKNIH